MCEFANKFAKLQMGVCLLLKNCEIICKKEREYEQICKFGLFALSMEHISFHLILYM